MITRRTHTLIRIDFSPFVSVALLLIVFFVWVEMVERPNLLPIATGWYSPCFPDWTDTKVLVIYLRENNKISYLTSNMEGTAKEIYETDYSVIGLREVLRRILRSVQKENLLIFIKPMEQSTFKNLTAVVNEMNIIGGMRYGIDEASPQEQKILSEIRMLTPGPAHALITRQ